MHQQDHLSQQRSPLGRLFNGILPKRSSKSKAFTREGVQEDAMNGSSTNMTCVSSSTLKRDKEMERKDHGTSVPPTVDDQLTKHVRYSYLFNGLG